MPLRIATIAFLTGILFVAAPARAADYRVVQCGAAGAAHDFLAASSDPVLYAQDRCSSVAGLSLKGIAGTHTKPQGAASWLAFAPDGTTFSFWEALFQGGTGGASTAVYARACRDLACASSDQLFFGLPEWGIPSVKRWEGAGAIMLQFALQCSFGASGGCNLGSSPPGGDMFSPRMALTDHHLPGTPNLTGGTLPGSGWKSSREPQSVVFSATDRGGGVDRVFASIDAKATATHLAPCARTENAYTRLLPCPLAVNATLPIDLSKLSDGPHSLSLSTVDAAGQMSTTGAYTVRVDNTAPASPRNVAAIGGDDWRAMDGFSVRWDAPEGQHAPITATHWRLCPLAGGACRSGRASGATTLKDVVVGRSGEFALHTSLEDAAGNHDGSSAAITKLRLDSDAPRLHFEQQDPADPLRVTVRVAEPLSGLAKGDVELRREGTGAWSSLDTSVVGTRLVARIDDERLSDGSYELRARAVDGAGNEATTFHLANGQRATLRLPTRFATRLRVGVRRTTRQRVTVRRNGDRKTVVRRTTVLRHQLRATLGQRPRVEGVLADARGNPLPGVEVGVAEATGGSEFRPAGTVRTDESGRFAYRLRARQSQIVRFHYRGSSHARGSAADVTLHVIASSTIRASARSVQNGDTVRFSGRLRTLPAPPDGKLMEMQAYFRNRWRTFSTVRTDNRGRWSFDYGFGGTVGKVLYRFRVHIPREGGYPFDGGSSHVARVTVQGP